MIPFWQTMTFARIDYLQYFLPVLMVVLFLLTRHTFWQKKIVQLLGARNIHNYSFHVKVIKACLLVASIISLMLALARPQWDEKKENVGQEGRDVLIALDISRSMLAQDVSPSRIEFAKKKIKDMVEQLNAERFALLIFSGNAFVQCPFTTDVGAFLNFLDNAEVEFSSSGTTALDTALRKAVETFNNVPNRKHKIMILFTDGEDFSTDLSDVDAQAQKQGISIFTVGIGTPDGAPIPLVNEEGVSQGHQKDEKGNIVITRLNEQLLEELSRKTHAHYIKAMEGSGDVTRLISYVQRYEREKFGESSVMLKEEKYGIFALISFICLCLERLL